VTEADAVAEQPDVRGLRIGAGRQRRRRLRRQSPGMGLAIILLVTGFVFWLVHVYAETVASIHGGWRFRAILSEDHGDEDAAHE
jgi:hypothetical protein